VASRIICGVTRRGSPAETMSPGRARRGRARPAPVEAGERGHPDEGPFELADVVLHMGGDELQDVVGDVLAVGFRLGPQDRQACLEVRGVDLGDQAERKRLRSRSSSVSIERGARSEVRTICFPAPWRSL